MAISSDSVWVSAGTSIAHLDPLTNRIVEIVHTSSFPTGLALDNQILWVALPVDKAIERIDLGNPAIRSRFRLGLGDPRDVVLGASGLWATDAYGGKVFRISSK
jgi:hypothetical protein